jgi:hypothetical protein
MPCYGIASCHLCRCPVDSSGYTEKVIEKHFDTPIPPSKTKWLSEFVIWYDPINEEYNYKTNVYTEEQPEQVHNANNEEGLMGRVYDEITEKFVNAYSVSDTRLGHLVLHTVCYSLLVKFLHTYDRAQEFCMTPRADLIGDEWTQTQDYEYKIFEMLDISFHLEDPRIRPSKNYDRFYRWFRG